MKFLETIISTDLPFITEGYSVLHYDQEPILFTGFNRVGNRILASSVETNNREKYELFFHTIIDENTYHDFIEKKVTYKKILADAGFIFSVKSTFDNKDEIYATTFDIIPANFVPGDKSYCPALHFASSLQYNMKLDGGEATKHLAEPESVNSLSEGFKKIIESGINIIQQSAFGVKVLLGGGGYIKSSFKINFNVDLVPLGVGKKQLPSLFGEKLKEEYIDFLKKYIDYSLNELGSEIESISKNEELSDNLKSIITSSEKLQELNSVSNSKETVTKNVIEGVKESAKQIRTISKTIGDGFSTISISNISLDGSENVLGFIDGGYKEKFEDVMNKIEPPQEEIKDHSPQQYSICIDKLSASKRNGSAIVTEGELVWTPSFTIKGEGSVSNTIFSESLHKRKIISVMAIATRNAETKEIKKLIIEP